MKLTLNKTWKNCLKMWKWIASEIEKDQFKKPGDLKVSWMRQHDVSGLKFACFFCQYAHEHDGLLDIDKSSYRTCSSCPGRFVSSKFNCELYKSYHWLSSPIKFYNKLVELDKKRRAKK